MRNGEVVLSPVGLLKQEEGHASLRGEANALEVRTGCRSRQRIAQEVVLPMIKGSCSWPDLHARLAERGFQYVRTATTNGAAILIDGDGVKCSDVHRSVTIGSLSRRFGSSFEPKPESVKILARDTAEDILPLAFRADEYREARETKRLRPDDHAAASLKSIDETLTKLGGKSQRDDIDEMMLQVLPLVRKKVATPWFRKRFAPDLEHWLHEQDEAWAAVRWRKRRQKLEERTLRGERNHHGPIDRVGDYVGYPCGEGTRYARSGEGTAFIDHGAYITVIPNRGADAIAAALDLAVIKFRGPITIVGSAKFRLAVYEQAAKSGLSDRIDGEEHARWRARRAPQRGTVESEKGMDAVAPGVDRNQAINKAREAVRKIQNTRPALAITPAGREAERRSEPLRRVSTDPDQREEVRQERKVQPGSTTVPQAMPGGIPDVLSLAQISAMLGSSGNKDPADPVPLADLEALLPLTSFILPYLQSGQATLSWQDGNLQAGCRSGSIRADIEKMASLPGGWQLMVALSAKFPSIAVRKSGHFQFEVSGPEIQIGQQGVGRRKGPGL